MRTTQRASGLARLRPGTCGSFRQSQASCAGDSIVSGRGPEHGGSAGDVLMVAVSGGNRQQHGQSGQGQTASQAYLGMVTPAFSQAWIRAAPASIPSATAPPPPQPRHPRPSPTYPRSRPSFHLFPVSVSRVRHANGSSSRERTDCELDLGGPLGCCRKGARGHAGLSASPPSRTGQRVPQHRCRRDGRGCGGEIGVGSRGRGLSLFRVTLLLWW
jgi:hypothetical protein